MGKKRKFNRFIRWIKSDLPNDNKSVLLLGVTKLPSPTPIRSRPHTLHLDHHLASAKSQTLDNQPSSRLKPRLFRSHSGDSLNELLTAKIVTLEKQVQLQKASAQTLQNNAQKQQQQQSNIVVVKKVQFDTKEQNAATAANTKSSINNNKSCLNSTTCFQNKNQKLGYCIEQPYDYYHPNKSNFNEVNDTTDFMMDKSVDSIGSCSLDVDASSTDFSDSSVGSSDCTLRSLGVPTPTTTTQPSSNVPSFRLNTDNFDVFEAKKPSYLNLACTVNGYSNITNYDSKLRENFRIPRSREVSPIRPQDYHAPRDQQQQNITTEKSTFLSPPPPSSNYQKTMLNSPSKMSESKSQTILRNTSTNYTSYTSSKKIIYSSSSDTVDQAFNTNTRSKITFSSNLNGKSTETYEYINGTSQNGGVGEKSKSFIQQRVERLYGPGALAQGFFISKRTKNRLSECSENGDYTTNGTAHDTSYEAVKSPVASVAQDTNEVNLKQSTSSPQLPVLRHLRPEFRAQLPILSPKRVPLEHVQKSPIIVPLTLNTSIAGPKLNGSENKENIENNKPVKLTDIITEEIPAAPQVVLPVPVIIPVPVTTNGIKLNGTTSNGTSLNGTSLNGIKEEIRDGHYFLKILKNEQDRLISLAITAETELEEKLSKMSDEQLGYLRSASGKARLLVTQKMKQFEGLCHKNINKIEGEQFPTTAADLQGFWDMVMLQVVQIDELFAELDRIRANNWVIEEKPKPETVSSSSETSKPKKLVVVKKAISAKAEAERKQREAARKKMLEDRRKAMKTKQQQLQQTDEQSIEIFVPESS